jgi:hypothetical protein
VKRGQGRTHRILDNPDLDLNACLCIVKLRKGGQIMPTAQQKTWGKTAIIGT